MAIELKKKVLSNLGKVIKLIFNISLPFATLFSAMASLQINGGAKTLNSFRIYLIGGSLATLGSATTFFWLNNTQPDWLMSLSGADFYLTAFALITLTGMVGRMIAGLILHPPIFNSNGSNSNSAKIVFSRLGCSLLFGLLGSSASDLWHTFKPAPTDFKIAYTSLRWQPNSLFIGITTDATDHNPKNGSCTAPCH